MAACKTTVPHLRRALLVLACTILPLTVWAARRVPVFLVDVADQSAPALQQAMRAALVRATGRPQSASDPAFATLVAQAAKYVVNYQHGPKGQLQVAFDGAAIDQVIASLGYSVWGADRPFTLVVLTPMPDQADYQADHDALEQSAEARGLPISVMPLPVTDASGRLLPREALLALVHRFGAEQLLVGQPPAVSSTSAAAGAAAAGSAVANSSQESVPATSSTAVRSPVARPSPSNGRGLPGGSAPPRGAAEPETAASAGNPPALAVAGSARAAVPGAAQWHWTLVTAFMRRSFAGSVTAGIDGTVNLLAPPPSAAADRSAAVPIRIKDVSTLSDYARIEVMLAAIPGVSRADVSEVQGDTAEFAVQAHGGDAAVVRMLSGSAQFAPVPAASGALVYRYVPGPTPASSSVAPPSTTQTPPPTTH